MINITNLIVISYKNYLTPNQLYLIKQYNSNKYISIYDLINFTRIFSRISNKFTRFYIFVPRTA